jgi:hypothetical protein
MVIADDFVWSTEREALCCCHCTVQS